MIALFVLALGATPASAPASAPTADAPWSGVDALERAVAALEPKLATLNATYSRNDVFDKDGAIRQRVSDGEILVLLGDHARASVVLFDVVSDPKNAVHSLYDRALYYLAESCFHTRNFVGARARFQQLISRGDKTFLFDAFQRLIEIAETLQDYSGVEEKVKELRDVGSGVLRPDVAYLYGKSLARRAKSEEAIAQLAAIAPDHKFYFRARYVIASELVRLKKLDEAAKELAKVIATPKPLGLGADEKDELLMREIASMALGRVSGEQGHVKEAMAAYQTISRDSPYLPQSLYEIAWMFVQQSGFATLEKVRMQHLRKSLQAIDIMLLALEDRVLVPKATVLKGNVLLKLGRYEDAVDAYVTVAKKYEPVYKELQQTLVNQTDPTKYFNEVIAKNQGTYNAAAFLPTLAVDWVSEEREVNRALGVAHDLSAADATVAESKVIGGKVLGALTTRRPIELFPQFKEGENHAVQLELEVRKLLERFLALLTDAVRPNIDGKTRDKLTKAQTARIKAQASLAEAAFKREESKRIESKHLAIVHDLDRRNLRLRTELASLNAQLVAVSKWLDDNKSKDTVAPDKIALLKEQMGSESKVLAELERVERELYDQLQQARTSSGGPVTNEQRARDDYALALNTELQLLVGVRERATLPATGTLRRLDALKDRLGSLDSGVRNFRDALAATIDHKTIQIANAVNAELELMQAYEQELKGCEHEAESLVGGVAAASFDNVKQRFYELVLKADLGVVDVSWREKEDRTQKINELVRAQKDAIDSLERDFRELGEERR